MSGKCYALAYTSIRGTTHYRIDQETGCRSPESATKYLRCVADFLRRPGEEVKMVRQTQDDEWAALGASSDE